MKWVKTFGFILILFSFSILLFGCKKGVDKTGDNVYYIYYLNGTEDQLLNIKYKPNGKEKRELIQEFLQVLKSGTNDKILKRNLPETMNIVKHEVDVDKKLTLYFDNNYSKITGIKEILYRAAIVKTLCQIPGVDFVQFYIDDQPLIDSEGKPIGFMKDRDFIDIEGDITKDQKTTVSMYFANKDGNKLIEVPVKIKYDSTESLEELIVEQCIKGPFAVEGINRNDIKSTLPQGTKLNNLTVKDKVCYIDFNSKFLDVVSGVSSSVTVYSIVNTLVDLSRVDKVQFTIDGKKVNAFGEVKNFDGQFERNFDIVYENKD